MTSADHNLLAEVSARLSADPFAGGGNRLRPADEPADGACDGADATAAAGGGAAHVKRWSRPDMAQRVDRERLDNFAELIAEGATITAAAKEIGVSLARGSQLFKRIREELGWQAC